MLTDGSPHPVDEEAGVVIVGSGAAGATAARWLAAAGRSVVVIEEGAPPPLVADIPDARAALLALYRSGGASVALGGDALALVQGRCVGGTTVVNGAIQVPLPEEVWREWVTSDARWAQRLPWRALEEARGRMDRELGVTETPAALWGASGAALRRGLGESVSRPTHRNAPGCRGAGRCLTGCPHGAKASADRTLLPRAIADGARVYARCAARRVVIRHGRAVAVEGRFSSGAPMTARARRAVFLAASAVHTPWLLLRSGVGGVGRGFQCHPGAGVAGLFATPAGAVPEATQAMESVAFLRDRFKLESLVLPPALRVARVPGVGQRLVARLALLDRVALWGVSVRAEARGSIHRGPWGPLVRYTTTARDRATLLRGLAVAAEAMLAAGALEVWPGVYGAPEAITTIREARALADVDPAPGVTPLVATHFFGGVPVGACFEAGGVQGLVVADSSLFPTNIGVNPMCAITAVATVVAERWV